MVRASKTASASTATPTVVSVAIEVPSAAPAAAEKKVRKPKAAAVEAPAVVAPVVEAAPAVTPVATESAEVVVDTSSKLAEFGAKINQVSALLASIKADYKALEKTIAKDLKNASKSKKSKKSSTPNPNRQASGFVKPSAVSEDLLKFFGKEAGTMMSRVEVSKEITAYIEKNSLKDKDNGRQINPDAKLTTLLKVGAGEVLTYFNLQRYLKIHFIKAEKA